MNNLRTKTKVLLSVSTICLFLTGLFAPQAFGVGESASVQYGTSSLGKKFSAKAFRPASLSWGVSVAPQEGAVTVLPMRVADLRFPGSGVMRFAPSRKLRPCRLDQSQLVGPAEMIYERCPSSIVGNGEATFQLGQSTSPLAFRKGTVVVLYGGLSGRNVRVRFAAWSGDTNAGVVADGVLLPSGRMTIALPVLTADSAVTSLSLRIPGKPVSGTWASGNAYQLRAGTDRGFVRMRCRVGQKMAFSASLLLGARKADGSPYGLTEQLYPKTTSRCGR